MKNGDHKQNWSPNSETGVFRNFISPSVTNAILRNFIGRLISLKKRIPDAIMLFIYQLSDRLERHETIQMINLTVALKLIAHRM